MFLGNLPNGKIPCVMAIYLPWALEVSWKVAKACPVKLKDVGKGGMVSSSRLILEEVNLMFIFNT